VRAQERLRAAEHHHFSIGGRWLLFDAVALNASASCELDAVILQRAANGAVAKDLLDAARAAGGSPGEARRRLRFLRNLRFLLGPREQTVPVEVTQPADCATFMINVSQRCNLTCPYCYVNRGQFDYDVMPLARMAPDTADRLVGRIHASFPDFRTYGYHFYGGEPLMNFDGIRRIVEAAEEAAERSGTETDYHITTNGTLLTPEVAAFFDRHRFTVYVSIDGDEATHDAYRRYADGRGSYCHVQQNLLHLRTKTNVHIIGSSVIREGLRLSDAMALLRSHGADQCKAERVHLRETDSLKLSDDEQHRYLEDIKHLVEHYVESLSAGRKPMDYRLSAKILQLLLRRRREIFCAAATRMFGIAADGEIYPCALHVGRLRWRLGHIDTGLDTEQQRAFHARFATGSRPQCQVCWSRNLCGGGCPAMVDRFGDDDCEAMRAESEAAIAVYQQMMEIEPALLYALVSPSLARWAASGEA
jgi:uncharacterized protein